TALDAMPAWLFSVSGDDLSKDGPVTVTIDRALNVAMRNTYGGLLSGATYVADEDQRSHSVHKGHIKNQVLTLDGGTAGGWQGESQFFPSLRFSDTRMRLTMRPDGGVDGIVGGYQLWRDFFYFLAIRGEGTGQVELSGTYYAMKKVLDGPPNPVTGDRDTMSA